MPAGRNVHRREAELAFEAISIEGGLLSPDWLARVAQLAAPGQSEVDYRVPKGLSLRDEIGRYWRIAQAHWTEFASGRKGTAGPKSLADRFVVALLREALGFESLAPSAPVALDGRIYPIGFSAVAGRVPVIIAPAGGGLDAPSTVFGDAGRRRSAFGLAQEFLNAAEDALWGISSDGVTMRLLRDNASLTRPAWIEADLDRIFVEERFSDFAALWLLAHETRFGAPGRPATECPLETWRAAGREEGTRARERLRRGVEEALVALGRGFLSHPENAPLRAALKDGKLTTRDYFQQLLRLVYRLIFLLTIEERGLLHPEGATEAGRRLYDEGYSLRRLRERAGRRSAHDRFSDLWEATKIVLRGLAAGEPRLGLPALAGLFAAGQCPALDAARLENRALLLAVFRLGWLREDSGLSRVNWRDMGPEELGSVYESLLELVPQVTEGGRGFAFASGDETKGNARKTTGSYYTPDSLVQVLLDTALEPVVRETIAAHPKGAAEALLGLAVVDPACGSGHFLLAAAGRLAAHVGRLRANGTPSVTEYRHALREVVSRCLYGVDVNPMAVELCRVSLWMEAVEPGLPLTFLNSHIRHGNALLGTTPELMAKGVPDAAWEPIEGDDKKIATALKKRNKIAVEGQRRLDTLWPKEAELESAAVAREVEEVEGASDSDAGALARKESRWNELLASATYHHQKLVADAWCAAFVWPKQPGPLADAAPTNELWWQIRDGHGTPPALILKAVAEIADRYAFFHWRLAFPRVFERGGFDVVLGNPPWERVKLQEQEFFASRSDEIAKAPNAAARKKLIAALPTTDATLWSEWCAASRVAEGQSHFVRNSGRYPLCGKGDVNTYAIFAEHNTNAVSPHGRAGFIVPSGIATDDTTKEFFRSLAQTRRLSSLYDFRNHDGLFYDVGHRRFKFCLLTLVGHGAKEDRAHFVFFAESAEHVRDPGRRFVLSPADISLLNPNTGTCATFRSSHDADINLAMYRRAGILWKDGDPRGNPWGLCFLRMVDMANDSGLFRKAEDLQVAGCALRGNRFTSVTGIYLPLLEAKMLYLFDHRYGDYADKPAGSQDTELPEVPQERLGDPAYQPLPRYWLAEAEVAERLQDRWGRAWLLGWRDITNATNERTVIASLIPRAVVGHKFPLLLPSADPREVACLYASLCSFALDYAARQKLGGTSFTYFILKQLPVLCPGEYSARAPWSSNEAWIDWLLPRVIELTFTAWDLEPFAQDIGYDGPPFRWDPHRRFLLRAELDAAFFHLYGLSRDDTAYVLDTFPIVRKNDEKAHGEYRTKRVILEVYDAMAEATRTGRAYPTRLDPPPADARVAHPPRQASKGTAKHAKKGRR